MCASKNAITDIPSLEAAISEFDCADLLSAVAGLQLLPVNAERIVRLEALAHIVASGKSKRTRKVAPHTLAALCNCEALQEIAHGEDPFDGVFCEEVLFHGGSYKVLPGITEHATFVLKRIMETIFFHQDDFPDASFVSAATQLIHGTLALSDRICSLGGLSRNPNLDATFGENIVIPAGTLLAQLKASVRFSDVTLREFLRSKGLPPTCLAPLTVSADDFPHEEDFQVSGLLARRPLVAGATDVVVASPTELLPALRNALVALAQDRGVEKELASRFGSATWQAVHEHLRYINCDALPLISPPWVDAPAVVHDGYYSLDTDKLIYCLSITDSLEDYDRNDPFGRWRTPDMTVRVSDRLRAVVEDAYSKLHQLNEVFAVVLTQTVGRFVAFGVGDSDMTDLVITAADLCTFCLLEGGKDLVLWQFAKSQETIRTHAKITQVGTLDEYAIYRKNRYTYYASDDYRPNMIFIAPGGAGSLRREVYRERDWHGVSSYKLNELIEIACLFSPDVPVYVPSERLGSILALVVEGLPLPVWVTGPDKEIQRDQSRLYREFVDALAYWIWQFATVLRPALRHVSQSQAILRVIVELDWAGDPDEPVGEAAPIGDEEQLVTTHVLADDGVIVLRFRQGIEAMLSGADNAGERLFVRQLLLAIRSLAPLHISRALRDHSLEQTIDCFAPLGLKKKVFYLSLARMPQLDRRGLPPPRHVQEVDKNALLDPMGSIFAETSNSRSVQSSPRVSRRSSMTL